MPKDRMAILGDPQESDLMYVAGNAGAFAWRVHVEKGEWIKMWTGQMSLMDLLPMEIAETTSGMPRVIGCSSSAMVVYFARELPRKQGGRWVSLNGDYASLELLSAHYDPRTGRFVAGAQDNCAIVTNEHAKPSDGGIGFVEGDGTVTLVDNVANPARLFGTTQFLGVGTIDIDPSTQDDHDGIQQEGHSGENDEDGCGGLCYAQGDDFINVAIDKYFPEPSSFPFFVQPYALNSQDPQKSWSFGPMELPRGHRESLPSHLA